MGYPMTFQRVLSRNGLMDGDYDEIPERHRARVNMQLTGALTPETWKEAPEEERERISIEVALGMAKDRIDRLYAYEQAFKALAGDLRRLEKDTRDEGAICNYIAQRIGLDVNVVAVVLKEFISW